MKLEIKHLAAYLPYGLRMIFEKSGRLITMQSCFYNGSIVITDENEGNCYDLSIWNFKPILRPLSDLTKEIEHNGEIFVAIDYLEDMIDFSYGYERIEYWKIQKLFEWHFDVFGLIGAGLAIDINTLNK